MLGLYLGAMVFGAVLIGVTLFFGSHDFDADTDLDVDLDHDLDMDVDADLGAVHGDAVFGPDGLAEDLDASNLWLPFTSMRFYTFFTFAFGLGGTIMTWFGVPSILTLGISAVVGFVLGWLAAWSFRKLYRDTVTGDVGVQRFVGQEARVLLPVRLERRGKIVLDSPMGQIELPAETGDDRSFSPGDRVLVAHIDEGVANITSIHLQTGEIETSSQPTPPPTVGQPNG